MRKTLGKILRATGAMLMILGLAGMLGLPTNTDLIVAVKDLGRILTSETPANSGVAEGPSGATGQTTVGATVTEASEGHWETSTQSTGMPAGTGYTSSTTTTATRTTALNESMPPPQPTIYMNVSVSPPILDVPLYPLVGDSYSIREIGFIVPEHVYYEFMRECGNRVYYMAWLGRGTYYINYDYVEGGPLNASNAEAVDLLVLLDSFGVYVILNNTLVAYRNLMEITLNGSMPMIVNLLPDANLTLYLYPELWLILEGGINLTIDLSRVSASEWSTRGYIILDTQGMIGCVPVTAGVSISDTRISIQVEMIFSGALAPLLHTLGTGDVQVKAVLANGDVMFYGPVNISEGLSGSRSWIRYGIYLEIDTGIHHNVTADQIRELIIQIEYKALYINLRLEATG